MNSNKYKFLFGWGFIALAALGLFSNLAFDLIAFRENKISNHVGELVTRSYDLQLKLEALRTEALHSTNKKQNLAIRKSLLEIGKGQLSIESTELLKKIDLVKVEDNRGLLELVIKIYENQAKSLATVINQNLIQNKQVENSMMRALALDFTLIIMLLVIFVLNANSKTKIEKNLKSSILRMRGLLSALEEESFRRKASLKTTVHDLKNPIGSIMGFAEIITESSDEKSSIYEFSDRIQKISERSLELVESMLRIEDNTPMTLSSVDLTTSIQEICAQLEVQAYAKKQILKISFSEKKLIINGNQMRIDELLANLISNAIKYSPKGSTIKIRGSLHEGKVRIEVQDEGPGFTAEDRHRAFQYGQRLSARPTNGESSTGFGLFMAKQIVDLHKGKIAIADKISGPGACIYFEIPTL